MTSSAPPRLAATLGLLTAVVLVSAAIAVPQITGWNVYAKDTPPLYAWWDPRTGPGTLPAIGVAVWAVLWFRRWAETLPWRPLLTLTWAAGVAWMVALAFVDGADGVGHILAEDEEYLPTAHATHDLAHTLSIYVSRIPLDAPDNWPVHIAGHPPGALTFFVLLDRLGLGSGFAAGLVVVALAASTAVAVAVALRALEAESWARKALPFLVFAPAAVWQAVSADAIFAAVAAWGTAALALAVTREGRRSVALAAVAGLLLGFCVMLSYGLPLLGVLAVAVLWAAQRPDRPAHWRRAMLVTVIAALAALGVVLAYAAFGFAWWEAIGVLRERYWDGLARLRPGAYWTWANLAALTLSAGPVAAAGVAVAVRHVARRDRGASAAPDQGQRVVLILSGAAVLMVVLADLSQMSRAETERIWLPFIPWLLLSCALLPSRWRTAGLCLQVLVALAVQHLFATGW